MLVSEHPTFGWIVSHDELTINQWQKDDPVYTKVLSEVCQGKPSKETLDLLSQRVMNETVTKKFQKLNEAAHECGYIIVV